MLIGSSSGAALAQWIAHKLGVNCRLAAASAIENVADLAAQLTNLGNRDILFVEDIHELGKAVAEVLFQSMENHVVNLVIGEGVERHSVKIELAQFSIIGETQKEEHLHSKLREKFGVSIHLTVNS